GSRASFMRLDVTDRASWAAVVTATASEFGRIDILINNAGILRVKSLLETDADTWDTVIAINQTGTLFGMQAVVPTMTRQRAGSIINVSSIVGLRGVGSIAYTASKWAVRGMTRSA